MNYNVVLKSNDKKFTNLHKVGLFIVSKNLEK